MACESGLIGKTTAPVGFPLPPDSCYQTTGLALPQTRACAPICTLQR